MLPKWFLMANRARVNRVDPSSFARWCNWLTCHALNVEISRFKSWPGSQTRNTRLPQSRECPCNSGRVHRGCSSIGRASRLQREGRGIITLHLHQSSGELSSAVGSVDCKSTVSDREGSIPSSPTRQGSGVTVTREALNLQSPGQHRTPLLLKLDGGETWGSQPRTL